MKKEKSKGTFQIVSISRSADSLYLKDDKVSENIKFSLDSYLSLKPNEHLAIVILSSLFFNEKEEPITNELNVQLVFHFENDLPIVEDNGSAIVKNYEELIMIMNISVGTYRGILYEWLKGSELQQPLPCIDIEEFINGLKISFSK